MHARTTGTARDTYHYDALGRIRQAARGTTTDAEAVASTQRSYTGLGDLDCEVQTIRKGTPRTTDYDHDQAGNQTLLGYPDGDVLTYTPTALNQVDSILRAGSPLVQYGYQGWQLHTRTTTTDAPGGATTYRQTWGYDAHRRVNTLTNTRDAGAGPETVADYLFTHDLNGNPTSQIVVTGLEDFVGDDRGFQVDRLNRLVGTAYYGAGETESTTFDRLGNREAHVNRQGETTQYTLANPANEYAAINGQAVQYDGTGNLSRDEDGHGYAYDEQNRLTRVFEDANGNCTCDAGETVLANYAYDAFGRRVEFENVGAGTTVRYYHDGVSVIQERDAADELVRSHVNGAQYLDEHVATFEATGLRAGETSYYLLGGNHSVVGVGSADGSVVTRLEYSPSGERIGPGEGTGSYAHDADADGDVDLDDFAAYVSCLAAPAGLGEPGTGLCLAFHDANAVPARREADGDVDLEDFAGLQHCFSGSGQPPPPDCFRPAPEGVPPSSGSFALHGGMVDVLSSGREGPEDALALQYSRARYFDLTHGRFLQRDPTGYTDGSNLYEAFGSNPARFTDPMGTDIIDAAFVMANSPKDIAERGEYDIAETLLANETALQSIRFYGASMEPKESAVFQKELQQQREKLIVAFNMAGNMQGKIADDPLLGELVWKMRGWREPVTDGIGGPDEEYVGQAHDFRMRMMAARIAEVDGPRQRRFAKHMLDIQLNVTAAVVTGPLLRATGLLVFGHPVEGTVTATVRTSPTMVVLDSATGKYAVRYLDDATKALLDDAARGIEKATAAEQVAGNQALLYDGARGLEGEANRAATSRLLGLDRPNRVVFEGFEVRAVHDLSHVDEATLRAMSEHGFAAKDAYGNSLIIHHHKQNPAGPLIEMPALRHKIGHKVQHPFGNQAGIGLTPQERAAHDAWRVRYWKARAMEELQRRGK